MSDQNEGQPEVNGSEQTDSQEQPDKWYASFQEGVNDSPSIQKFSSAEALAKGYMNHEQHLGKDKVAIPKVGEDFTEFFKAAGRPEDGAGYELPEIQDDGSKEFQDSFRETAFKAGLNQSQVQQFNDWYAEQSQGHLDSEKVSREHAWHPRETQMRGQRGERWDANMGMAEQVIIENAAPESAQHIIDSGLGVNPEFIKIII